MITQERLKELVHYDPETGVMTWRVNRGKRFRAGDRVGSINSNGYRVTSVDGYKSSVHRLAWLYVHGYFPECETDHINGIRDDNRLCNLRAVSWGENQQNRVTAKSDSKTGLLGVSLSNNGRQWLAQIQHDRKVYSLGRFDTQQEAHAAYLAAKRILHKGFPRWNELKPTRTVKSPARDE